MDVKYSELKKKEILLGSGERAFIHSFIQKLLSIYYLFGSVGHAKMNKT